jgi:DNA-binding NtrC family response regulator
MARIYVVDDDVALAECIAEALRLQGHTVTVMPDTGTLKMHLPQNPPDLAVVDVQMGGGGGPAAAKVLPDFVPLIVVSGMPVEKQKPWFPGRDKIAFFSKPADVKKIAEAAAELLRR